MPTKTTLTSRQSKANKLRQAVLNTRRETVGELDRLGCGFA